MTNQRTLFWAIAERIIDDKEIGRIAIAAENEACALDNGRWALVQCLSGHYRLTEFTTRVEIANKT